MTISNVSIFHWSWLFYLLSPVSLIKLKMNHHHHHHVDQHGKKIQKIIWSALCLCCVMYGVPFSFVYSIIRFSSLNQIRMKWNIKIHCDNNHSTWSQFTITFCCVTFIDFTNKFGSKYNKHWQLPNWSTLLKHIHIESLTYYYYY